MTKMEAYIAAKQGVCGCTKCGLRGYSKNVATRSVFAIWKGLPLMLETYDSCMVAKYNDEAEQYLFGTNSRDWAKDDAPARTLADVLVDYLRFPESSPEDLKILLCVHDWVQDEGTATV